MRSLQRCYIASVSVIRAFFPSQLADAPHGYVHPLLMTDSSLARFRDADHMLRTVVADLSVVRKTLLSFLADIEMVLQEQPAADLRISAVAISGKISAVDVSRIYVSLIELMLIFL